MTRDQHLAQALEHVRLAAAKHGAELDDAMRQMAQSFTALKRAQKFIAEQANSMPRVVRGRSAPRPPHSRASEPAESVGADCLSLETNQ